RGGPEHLRRVVQRGLLADDHPADRVPRVQREVGEVFEQVALSVAEPAAEQQPPRDAAARGSTLALEPVLDCRLPATQGGDGVAARYPGAQRLDRPPLRDVAPHGVHAATSTCGPTRTMAAYGLIRHRSR